MIQRFVGLLTATIIVAVLVFSLLPGTLLHLPGERAQAAYSFAPGAASYLAAVGTAFTYQGQLRQDGQVVNGACDFEYRLWDAASDGAQVGSMLPVNNLSVSGGLFSASLDFGAGAFNGQARWLEVGTRCPAGSGSFTGLGRQPLAPAPYALYAAAADNAAALGGQPSSYYQARVSGACAVGTTIQAVNADGTVQCQPAIPVFTRTVVDSAGSVGRYTSIAIGSDGQGQSSGPLISYSDAPNGNLKVAHCNDTACTSASIYTLDSAGDVGYYTSIAIGSDGQGQSSDPLISYYDNTNGDLKVAHCNDAACSSASTYTLDSAGDVGYGTSLAIGSDGLGLISYLDNTNGDLKVAHCSDTACSSANTYILDGTGNVGFFTSITIGSDGLGLISYQDFTNGDLKVAHCNDAACSSADTYTLDSAGSVGDFTSITIGSDDLGLISYLDGTNGDLKVAHCNDTACTGASTYTLDSTGDVGYYTSITIGGDGQGQSSGPLISYFDNTNSDLKVAHCNDAACISANTYTLDSAGSVGAFTSLAIGDDGLGLISYYDYTYDDLKVVHCDEVVCAP